MSGRRSPYAAHHKPAPYWFYGASRHDRMRWRRRAGKQQCRIRGVLAGLFPKELGRAPRATRKRADTFLNLLSRQSAEAIAAMYWEALTTGRVTLRR